VDQPIRILSDLHFGHAASLAREIAQLEPLYDGVRTVVLNGDTVEMRSERCRARTAPLLQELRDFCAAQEASTFFINGNHDPIISTVNHLEIDDGRLLVTHGDSLVHEAKPGAVGHRFRACPEARAVSESEAGETGPLERILSTSKRVARRVDLDRFTIPNGPWGRFSTFMKQTWPPKRLVRTVSSWKNTPLHAINLVRLYRPETRCVVVGHTHVPGIWHRKGYCVINTGSFLPVLGRLAVDYEDGAVTVRKVVLRRGQFRLGNAVARFHVRGWSYAN
jgi:exonuclease SbcD